jgi:3,4-dihydroxy-2-butanone 4-phosphate synthase
VTSGADAPVRPLERLYEHVDAVVQVVVRDDQRREQPDDVVVGARLQDQHAVVVTSLRNGRGLELCGLARLLVDDELETHHRAEPAHLADDAQ